MHIRDAGSHGNAYDEQDWEQPGIMTPEQLGETEHYAPPLRTTLTHNPKPDAYTVEREEYHRPNLQNTIEKSLLKLMKEEQIQPPKKVIRGPDEAGDLAAERAAALGASSTPTTKGPVTGPDHPEGAGVSLHDFHTGKPKDGGWTKKEIKDMKKSDKGSRGYLGKSIEKVKFSDTPTQYKKPGEPIWPRGGLENREDMERWDAQNPPSSRWPKRAMNAGNQTQTREDIHDMHRERAKRLLQPAPRVTRRYDPEAFASSAPEVPEYKKPVRLAIENSLLKIMKYGSDVNPSEVGMTRKNAMQDMDKAQGMQAPPREEGAADRMAGEMAAAGDEGAQQAKATATGFADAAGQIGGMFAGGQRGRWQYESGDVPAQQGGGATQQQEEAPVEVPSGPAGSDTTQTQQTQKKAPVPSSFPDPTQNQPDPTQNQQNQTFQVQKPKASVPNV
jgi:hypothetical protein